MTACATKPSPIKLDWEILEIVPGEQSACLPEDDVIRLREYMLTGCGCEDIKK